MATQKIVTKPIGRTLPDAYVGNPGDVWINTTNNTIHFWNGKPGGEVLLAVNNSSNIEIPPKEKIEDNSPSPIFSVESGVGVEIDAKETGFVINIGQDVSPKSSPVFSSLKINQQDVVAVYVGDFKFSSQKENHGSWLLCDGSSLLRLDYPELFSVIGTTYGNGGVKGNKKFSLPKFSDGEPHFGNQFIYSGKKA